MRLRGVSVIRGFRRWGRESEGRTGVVAIVGPAGKDAVGGAADSGVFLFAGGDLAEMGLGCREDIAGELEFGEIADDCDADGGGTRGVELMDDCGVDRLILQWGVSNGVDGAGEVVGGLVVAVEEGDDRCCDRRALWVETNELEDDAGADGADSVVALEVGDEWGEDCVGRLGTEASEDVGCGAADVGVVVGEVGGNAGDLGFEKRQGVAPEGSVRVRAALYGDDAVEGESADGWVLVVDRLHDRRENVFYFGERSFAKCFGEVEDSIEGGGVVTGVGAIDTLLQ